MKNFLIGSFVLLLAIGGFVYSNGRAQTSFLNGQFDACKKIINTLNVQSGSNALQCELNGNNVLVSFSPDAGVPRRAWTLEGQEVK